jgi:hypothetical protein
MLRQNCVNPQFAFASIWTEFKGDRGTKSKPVSGPQLLYAFLTTETNTIVEPKVMPVILTSDEERDVRIDLGMRRRRCSGWRRKSNAAASGRQLRRPYNINST